MDVLDSPLEALAFNYLSSGFLTAVNNIWTWVTVITAAVSFWRIRAAGGACAPLSDPNRRIPDGSPPPPPPPPSTAVNSEPASTSSAPLTTTTRASASAPETAEGVTTRGKFTVYYEDDREVDDGGDGGFGEVGSSGGGGEYWCEEWKWERVMKMRMEVDMGWYLYQDFTVLDGNVVRLWDGCRQRRSITAAAAAAGGGGVSFSASSVMQYQ